MLWGDDHAYGLPLTGTGTEASVAALTRDALADFHHTWFRPNNATLVVVGATSLDEILPKLERRFGKWKSGEVPAKNLAPAVRRNSTQVYLVDRPESEQSMIFAIHLAPPQGEPRRHRQRGPQRHPRGHFHGAPEHESARGQTLGLLRPHPSGQHPWAGRLSVGDLAQTDKTAESMAEIHKELAAIVGDVPPTAEELAKVKDKNTLTLPGRWERNDAVAQDIVDLVRFGFDDGYWDDFPNSIRGLTLDEVTEAGSRLFNPDGLLWVIVGDRAKIETPIQALGFGDIQLLDVDGNRL